MSDINRVPLTSVSQATSSKSNNVKKKTIRIYVKLPKSNENTCPEYNYQDELEAVKRKASSNAKENGRILDMLDDDDDVRRIASEMEKKYGNATSNNLKKKRKGRKDDYADIGMGYDESDSFIDNTDGYDEIIPQHVTTLHGGFYINSGALEFKTDENDSSEDSSDSETSSSGQSRKRSLDSEGSEDDDKPHESKRLKLSPKENGMQKALKKKLFSPEKILKKKKLQQSLQKKTVSELLKEKRMDLNLSVGEPEKESSGVAKFVENGKHVSNSICDAIESVVKASEESLRTEEKISSQVNDVLSKPVMLPENLPKNILNIVNAIKEKGAHCKDDDKFTKEINHLLTSLERKSKFLGKPSKYKVYENLSYYLKVEKQVLIQHCNQLSLKDDQHKIESLLRQLKAEIDKVMPSIITTYEKECELVIERRNQLLQLNQEGDEKRVKSIGRPKRKFQWNDLTRKFLKDTATLKKRSFLNQNNSIDLWEEELLTFLKNKVIHLWPEGWMTMTTLTKVCNKLFNETNTAKNSPSSKKESNKVTAINTPNLPYPNLSITPVVNNSQNRPKSSPVDRACENKMEKVNSNPVEHFNKDFTKENIPKENNHKEYGREKKETDHSSDHKNNNADSFFKVDYDKVQPVHSSSKHLDLIKNTPETAKLPNVSIIELDGPTDFRNILPKTKFESKNDSEISNAVYKKPSDASKITGDISQKVTSDINHKKSSDISHKKVSDFSHKKTSDINYKMAGDFSHKSAGDISHKMAGEISHKKTSDINHKMSSDIGLKIATDISHKITVDSSQKRAGENSNRKERTLIVNDYEINSPKPDDSHLNLPDGDDIQKVMEHLKTLQQMSSPVKPFDSSSYSNSSFSPKSSGFIKNNATTSFQDEYQKQLLNALGSLGASSSKSTNYKCS